MNPIQQAIAFLKQKGAEVSQLQQVQAIRSGAKTAVSNLDPANEQTPILGAIRQFNREHLGAPDTRGLSPEEKIASAMNRYGESFMGSHGDPAVKTPALTTTILDRLDGKQQVSPQYIENLTRMKDVKQADALLAQKLLRGQQGKVDVPEFADKMRQELLPLDRVGTPDGGSQMTRQYEHVNLPSDLKTPATNYSENIYESPIRTGAGNVHFSGQSGNYFAHTRTEDIYPDYNINDYDFVPHESGRGLKAIDRATGKVKSMFPNMDDAKEYFTGKHIGGEPTTRRVLEVQSDLFQKGRLDKYTPEEVSSIDTGTFEKTNKTEYRDPEDSNVFIDQEELNQLKPYENTWHERVIRDEVKKAAQDGMTKLQFPVGDTAMKIEGLGNNADKWYDFDGGETGGELTPNMLHEGKNVWDGYQGWTVVKNIGDGKFKAVDELATQNDEPLYRYLNKKGWLDDGMAPSTSDLVRVHGNDPEVMKHLERLSEQFDISGKTDTSNPIYKFYEDRIGKYLKNKYNAQRVKDPQGVEWWEVPVDKQAAHKPVEAFAVAPLAGAAAVLSQKRKEEKKQ